MAGNNASVGISQNRGYKAELSNRCDDLINLLFWMGSRIARIVSKRTYLAIGDRERRRPRRIRARRLFLFGLNWQPPFPHCDPCSPDYRPCSAKKQDLT